MTNALWTCTDQLDLSSSSHQSSKPVSLQVPCQFFLFPPPLPGRGHGDRDDLVLSQGEGPCNALVSL